MTGPGGACGAASKRRDGSDDVEAEIDVLARGAEQRHREDANAVSASSGLRVTRKPGTATAGAACRRHSGCRHRVERVCNPTVGSTVCERAFGEARVPPWVPGRLRWRGARADAAARAWLLAESRARAARAGSPRCPGNVRPGQPRSSRRLADWRRSRRATTRALVARLRGRRCGPLGSRDRDHARLLARPVDRRRALCRKNDRGAPATITIAMSPKLSRGRIAGPERMRSPASRRCSRRRSAGDRQCRVLGQAASAKQSHDIWCAALVHPYMSAELLAFARHPRRFLPEADVRVCNRHSGSP